MRRMPVIIVTAVLCMALACTALADGYPSFDFEKKAVTLNSG